MENLNIGNITVTYSELLYPNILEQKNVIYKLSYDDGKIYIGKAKDMGARLKQHCLYENNTRHSRHLHDIQWVQLDILHQVENEDDLNELEKASIHLELLKLSEITGIQLQNLDNKMIHQTILNDVLYR